MTTSHNQESASMPFDSYLADSPPRQQQSSSNSHQPLQLHIPSLLPTLAHGGGAEVLPLAMFASPYQTQSYDQQAQYPSDPSTDELTMGDAWMIHNGFSGMGFVGQHQSPSRNPYAMSGMPSPEAAYPQHRRSASRSSALTRRSSSENRSPVAPPPLSSKSQSFHLEEQQRASTPSSYPFYSTSGLDLMGILARVSTRRNKTIDIGPVDESCSFVLVDIRRFDSPMIYCSQTFCDLTGYSSKEVIGRNCRLLQSPPGVDATKAPRSPSSLAEVTRMSKMLADNKECQAKIINYRKDGTEFLNLVTVIPIGGAASSDLDGGEDRISFHVGFQVDLGALSGTILKGMEGGRWVGTNIVKPYINAQGTLCDQAPGTAAPQGRPPKVVQIPTQAIHEDLRKDHAWLKQILPSSSPEEGLETMIDKVILEMGPDLVWVVSLKGTFLYVSGSVRRVLGYEPEELVGKGLGDVCHPKDLVPVLRELKESCAFSENGTKEGADEPQESGNKDPKVVDLMFRALTKSSKYVWIHSRGRLHVEPGKGRKAIILSARAREMGSLHVPQSTLLSGGGAGEFWGTMSETGVIMHVGDAGLQEVVGVGSSQVIGKKIMSAGGFVCGGLEDLDATLKDVVESMRISRGAGPSSSTPPNMEPRHVNVHLSTRVASGSMSGSSMVPATMTLFPVRSICPSNVDGAPADAMDIDMPAFASSSRRMGFPDVSSVANETNNVVSPPSITFRVALSPPSHSGRSMGEKQINVFEELSVSRDSSWQYELQQLKFANERLREEVRNLEGLVGDEEMQSQPQERPSAAASAPFWSYYPTDSAAPSPSASTVTPGGYGGSSVYGGNYGYGPPSMAMSMSSMVRPELGLTPTSASSLGKRPWDADGPGGD